jgi:hypothetical protein
MTEYTPSRPASIGYMQPGYTTPGGWTVAGPDDWRDDPAMVAIDASIEDLLRTQSLLLATADADLSWLDAEFATPSDPLPVFIDPCDEIAAGCEARTIERDRLRSWWVADVRKASEGMLMFWLSDADKLQAIDLNAIIIAELTLRSGGACNLAA